VTDGVQQVRLAAARPAMNEERIEAYRLGRRQRLGCGCRDLVRLADDKRLEAVARIEVRS